MADLTTQDRHQNAQIGLLKGYQTCHAITYRAKLATMVSATTPATFFQFLFFIALRRNDALHSFAHGAAFATSAPMAV
jgi:hypothetical protein